MESQFKIKLESDFNIDCKNRKKCTISYNFEDFNPECLKEIYRRASFSKYRELDKYMEENNIEHD